MTPQQIKRAAVEVWKREDFTGSRAEAMQIAANMAAQTGDLFQTTNDLFTLAEPDTDRFGADHPDQMTLNLF